MGRSSVAVHWADIGNLILHDGTDPAATVPALISAAAEWLLLGGVTRLLAYWAEDVDPAGRLAQLENAGFRMLVRNARGFTRTASVELPGGVGLPR